jgi:hypothetical protein
MRLGLDRQGRVCLAGYGVCGLDLGEDLLGSLVVIRPPVIGPPGKRVLYLRVITARVLEWLTAVPSRGDWLPTTDLARAVLDSDLVNGVVAGSQDDGVGLW